MLLVSDQVSFATFVLGLVGSGGVAAGIVALIKVKPERDRVIVDAAQGAVVVQTGVIDRLNKEIERLDAEHKECEENRAKDRAEFNRKIEALQKVVDAIDDRKQKRREGDPPPPAEQHKPTRRS